MNGNRGVTQHGFRPRRCDFNIRGFTRLGIDDLVSNMPEEAFAGFVKDLVVTDGGLQKRVPIDQAFATIDQ